MTANPLSGLTNLQQRIVSGVVLATLVIALTWVGGFAFRLLCVGMAAAIYVEWRKITRILPNAGTRISELGLTLSFAVLLAGLPPFFVFACLAAAISLAVIIALAGQASRWLPIGIAYAGIPAACLVFLRGDSDQSLGAIIFLFAIVWSTDVFAYFVGRSLKGPKLSPTISPGKTWSGAIGGTAAAVAAGLTVAYSYGAFQISYLPNFIILISALSQIGDLFESWIKRLFNAKDSGSIIPGHGGVMDRVDGLVVAATALYLLISISS